MNASETAGGRPVSSSPSLDVALNALGSPRFGAMLTIVSAAALGAGLIVWSLRPEFVPIGQHANGEEAVAIVGALDAAGVDYRLDNGTGLVMVPRDALARVRMDLAAAGLSKADAVGLEMLGDAPSLGTSHFTETARYQHALETELARTIGSLHHIESARVHLALPKQSVFVRDRGSASASVTLRARAGQSLDDEQVAAVVNLVAASIPLLDSGDIAVVDQFGRLLTQGEDSVGGASREAFEHARRLENLYTQRIESLLTPIVGEGRVRASVTAEVDMALSEQTEEAFEPDPGQMRSEQTESRIGERTQAAAGVPGALTNQPPAEGFIEEEGNEAVANGDTTLDRSESAVRNYELDKTITHTQRGPGAVVRLSAAVIIDDSTATDEEGNVVRTPLTDEVLAEYTALAREAIGFDEARGDTVTVTNRAFLPVEELPAIEPLPLWEQPWVWSLARQVLVGLAVLMLVLLVIRPAVRRLDPVQSRLALSADGSGVGEGDEAEAMASEGTGALPSPGSVASASAPDKRDPALASPPVVYGDILNMARAMAAEDPQRVAKVVRDWVGKPS